MDLDSHSGVLYSGTVDLATAIAAVEDSSRRASLRCELRQLPTGEMCLRGVRTRPWYRVLATAGPQDVEWRLRQTNDGLSIRLGFRLERWYASIVVALALFVAVMLIQSSLSGGRESDALTLLFFLALFISPAVLLLLGALGGGRQVVALWQPVLNWVEKAGGRLEPRGRTVTPAYIRAAGMFAGVFVVASARPVLGGYRQLTAESTLGFGLSLTLAAFLLLLLLAVVLMFRRHAFMLRSDPLLAGLVSTGFLLLYLSLPWMLAPMAPDIAELVEGHESATALLARQIADPATDPIRIEKTRRALSTLRSACRLLLFFILSLLLVAVLLLFYGIHLLPSVWATLLRLQRQREQRLFGEEMHDPRLVRLYRWVFVPCWALFAGILLTSLGLHVFHLAVTLFQLSSEPQLHPMELSFRALVVALGHTPGAAPLRWATHGAWWLYGLSGPALLMLSVGHLLVIQRSERCKLRAAAARESPRRSALQSEVDELARAAGLGRIHLVVTNELSLNASASVYGLWPPERFAELTRDTVDLLPASHLRALLAHEIVHHLHGDCRRVQLVRWLGRLSFVGDGFALTLLNTWQNEKQADHDAVRRLGIPEETYRDALRSLDVLRDLYRKKGATRHSGGLKLHAADPEALRRHLKDPATLSLSDRLRIFLWLYAYAMDLYTWHPARRDGTATTPAASPPRKEEAS